jgi:hypothetical protein
MGVALLGYSRKSTEPFGSGDTKPAAGFLDEHFVKVSSDGVSRHKSWDRGQVAIETILIIT